VEEARMREDMKAAKKKVEEKKVILDKLGRVRDLIGFIKPIGEAVNGVSVSSLSR
jgi:hypothetical protein